MNLLSGMAALERVQLGGARTHDPIRGGDVLLGSTTNTRGMGVSRESGKWFIVDCLLVHHGVCSSSGFDDGRGRSSGTKARSG